MVWLLTLRHGRFFCIFQCGFIVKYRWTFKPSQNPKNFPFDNIINFIDNKLNRDSSHVTFSEPKDSLTLQTLSVLYPFTSYSLSFSDPSSIQWRFSDNGYCRHIFRKMKIPFSFWRTDRITQILFMIIVKKKSHFFVVN